MKGIFLDGRVRNIEYETKSHKGLMENGAYEYEEGEAITFRALGLELGTCEAKKHITPIDLVENGSMENEKVITIMRFLMLFSDGSPSGMINMTGAELHGAELTVESLEKNLGVSLPYVSKCRNRLRRAAWGILRENIRIPMSDGTYLAANLFRPFAEGKYPVIVTDGAFGMVFYKGWDGNAVSEKYYDDAEDGHYQIKDPRERAIYNLKNFMAYYPSRMTGFGERVCPIPRLSEEDEKTGMPEGIQFGPMPGMEHVTHFECPDIEYWGKAGYAVALIDERGCGKTPGYFQQFGKQNGLDYAQAVTWLSEQPWCNGNVGSYGASYYAMTQYSMAQHQPKGLKAMIAISGDYDPYDQYIYSGNGVFNCANFMAKSKPSSEWQGEEWLQDRFYHHPYYEDDKYGLNAPSTAAARIDKVTVPVIVACEGPVDIHTRGSNAAYHNIASTEKKFWMDEMKGIHFWMYEEPFLTYSRRFFDKYLKNIESEIEKEPRVTLKMRGSGNEFKTRYEEDWPVPGTQYVKMYFNAETGSIDLENPSAESSVTYDADIKRTLKPVPCRGAVFTSEPFESDMDIGGFIKMGMTLSTSTTDMELHVKVTAIDENGVNVPFYTNPEITHGSCLASHNQVDKTKSDEFITVIKHRKEDCPPLKANECTFCQFDLLPTLVMMHKGWRLKVEIDPINNDYLNAHEEQYRVNSKNTLYTGGKQSSWICLPVLPSVSR